MAKNISILYMTESIFDVAAIYEHINKYNLQLKIQSLLISKRKWNPQPALLVNLKPTEKDMWLR